MYFFSSRYSEPLGVLVLLHPLFQLSLNLSLLTISDLKTKYESGWKPLIFNNWGEVKPN